MLTIRVPVAVVAGVLSSSAIFLALSRLVSVTFDAPPLVEARKIEFTAQRIDTPIETKRKERITREPPMGQPERPRIGKDFGGDAVHPVRLARQSIDPLRPERGIGLRGVDGDVIPLVRPTGEYPPGAAAKGIEGWVQVRFSVTAAGTVRDAVVVASEPRAVFDQAALKAIARWRYNPRVENGVAVERVGLETVFRFELTR